MFIYINENDEKTWPVGLGELKRICPDTSFPFPFPPEGIPEMGVYPLNLEPQPEFDYWTEEINTQEPVYENNKWVIKWVKTSLSTEKLQEKRELKELNIRTQRTNKLIESDWTQLPDSSVDSNAWAVYRQALRDITAQDGFPDQITWPTEPTI